MVQGGARAPGERLRPIRLRRRGRRGRRSRAPVADVAELADAALAECVNADHLGLHALLLCTYAHLLIDRFDDADALLG